MKPSSLKLVVVLFAIFSLLAAACGNDDDVSSGDDTAGDVSAADDSAADDASSGDTAADDSAADDASSGDTAADDSAGDDASSGDTAADDSAGDDSAADDASSDDTAADDSAVNRDAVLRVAMQIGLESFDPAKITSSSGQTYYYYPVYEPLLRIGLASGQPEPQLAEAFEWSDDGLALTITLREGVTFSDGAPVNAEAVKANIDRYKELESSQTRVALASVESVEVIDSLTAVINLSRLDSSLTFNLTTTAGMMVSPDAFDNPDLDRNPVGAGPYIVTTLEPGTYVEYERNPLYWNPDIQHLARIEATLVADATTRFNALRTGEVDVAWLGNSMLMDQAESAGFTVTDVSAENYSTLYINFADESDPLADVRVRRAISHAIDKVNLANVIVGGGGAWIQLYPPGSPFANPDITEDPYPFDPDRARELLAEAGYADGLSLTMIHPTGLFNDAPPLVQDMLSDVGIDIEIRPVEIASATAVFFGEKQGDLMLALRPGRSDPAVQIAGGFLGTSRANPSGLSVPEIEEMYVQILATTDLAERTELVQAVVGLIAENLFDVPLTSARGWSAIGSSACVQGFPTILPANFADAYLLNDC